MKIHNFYWASLNARHNTLQVLISFNSYKTLKVEPKTIWKSRLSVYIIITLGHAGSNKALHPVQL